MKRKAIVVASGPRTGSSCLAGIISLCGASVGRSQSTAKNKYNERGYFENERLTRFNVRSLDAEGAAIFKPRRVYLEDRQVDTLSRLVVDEFAGCETIVLKDPRMLLLWSAYSRALADFDVRVARLRRSRDACCRSLAAFGPARELSESERRYVWNYYDALISVFALEYPGVDVQFERIEHSAQSLCSVLGLKYNAAVKTFIDTALRHWP